MLGCMESRLAVLDNLLGTLTFGPHPLARGQQPVLTISSGIMPTDKVGIITKGKRSHR
jgi:hypothetical protein